MSQHPNRMKSWPNTLATVAFGMLVISVIASAVLWKPEVFESLGTIFYVSFPLAVLCGILSILALCIGKRRVWSLVMLLLSLAYVGYLILAWWSD